MKILLTGTIHAGKTTLLQELKKTDLRGITVIPEVAREVLSQYPELEKNPNLQDILFAEQVRREGVAEETSPITICDRGSLDIIAHSRMFGHSVKPEWIKWLNTYDATFLLDKNDIPFNGENRALSDSERDWISFRDDLDMHIRSVVSEYGIPVIHLTGSPENRAERLSLHVEEQYRFHEGYGRRSERI